MINGCKLSSISLYDVKKKKKEEKSEWVTTTLGKEGYADGECLVFKCSWKVETSRIL